MTYTNGFQLKAIKNITKNDFLLLCDFLNENFENITFEPEPITEGGIVYKPNLSSDKYYKSFRLNLNDIRKWRITEEVMSSWRNNEDVVIYKNEIIHPFLKAFYEAPSYTQDELKIWESGFSQIGLIVKGRYPSKKSLKIRIH